MHVLFDARLLHRPLSGLERVQRNLLRELAANPAITRLRVVVMHGTRLPAEFPKRAEPVFVHGTEDILRELTGKEAPDVYHLSWFPDRNPRDLWLPLMAKASVVEVHDAILNRHPEYHPNHECWKWYSSFVTRLVRNADRLLVHSRSVAKEVENDIGGDPSICDLAPLAVEPTLRTPLSEEAARARRDRLGMPARYFLAVGKDYPHKGHNTMFRALAQIDDDISIVCAGSQVWHGQGSTKKEIEDLGLQDRVRWIEGLDDEDVKALIQGATALLYPSTEEGFGLPPIEAMALGTPVIAASAMSIPEVCKDGAWLFPAGDSRAMSRWMHKALTDRVAVAELVARGREVEASYSWSKCAELTIACYRNAIDESRKPEAARKRPKLTTAATESLQVQAVAPFSVERELAAWQERCLSVENTLRELRVRIDQQQPPKMETPSMAQPPAAAPPMPAPTLMSPTEDPRPKYSLMRRIRKIRAGFMRWAGRP
jgi:glycosyltransferase involved in cell wall biosynthesis